MSFTPPILDPSIPASIQVANGLRQEILAGSLVTGSRVPAIRTLAKELHVAPGTIRVAYKILIDEGLLRANVLGTFIEARSEISTARLRTVETHIEIFRQSLLDRGFTFTEVQASFRRLSLKEEK